MKTLVSILIIIFCCSPLLAQTDSEGTKKRVASKVDTTHADNMVLIQSFVVNVNLDSVWNAYTTKKGMESWAAANAAVDLRVNGTVKTTYKKSIAVGDPGTITLHLLNFVPKRMLTLQAELSENFPEFMRADEKNLYNTVLFEALNDSQTKVTSYGIGYRNNEKYQSLMKFFIQGNEQSYLNLIKYLETGKPSVNY